MQRVKSVLLFAILAGLSFAAALVGGGLSYHSFITPRSSFGELQRIHGDGWVEDGSAIELSNLAQRGNKVLLSFNPWRPEGLPPAHIRASLCGESVSEFQVSSAEPIEIFLTGLCQPRELVFEVLNPFVPSQSDRRKLGAQLNTVRVSSRIGMPILTLDLLVPMSLMILGLSWLVYAAFAGSIFQWMSLTVPVASLALIQHSRFLRFDNIHALWILAVSIVLGIHLAKLTEGADEGVEDPSKNWLWLALLIMCAGGALRFYGLDFGLPANYHPDEVPKVNALMRMRDHGDLNPRYFLHPSFLLYSTYFVNTIFHFFGMSGEWRETAFLAGRTVSAIGGTVSIFLVYCIGRRLFSARVGLIGSLFFAFLPLHVTCSRYLKEDAYLLFMILCCTALVLKAVQEDRKRYLLLAGLFGGLSMSVKYSGLLSVCIIGAAPWLRSQRFIPDKSYIAWTALALCIFPLGFLTGTPYAVLDSQKFLKDFNSERNHMLRGHTITIDAWSQFWMYHYSRSIVPGMTYLTAILGSIGIGVLLWTGRIKELFLLCLILLFYLPAEFVKAKPAPQPERYIVPCLPFLALAAACAVRRMAQLRFRPVAVTIFVLALGLPLYRSLSLSSEITEDTRDKMAAWMIENLPHGSKVYLDWKPYGPRFWNNEFDITYVPRAKIIPMLHIGALKESGQDYLVLSSLFYERYFSQPKSDAAIRDRFRQLFDRVPVVTEFRPEHGTYGFHNPTVTLFSLKEQDFARLEAELEAKKAGEIEQTTNEARAQFRWRLDD